MALGGEVELAGVVVGAGGHRLDLAVARVDRDQRRGGVGGVGEGRAHRLQADLLELRVDRRVDPQAAVSHRVDPVAVEQLVFDVVEEEGLAMREVGAGDVEAEAVPPRRAGARRGDVAQLGHLGQHGVAPLPGLAGVQDRVVVGGRLRQAGEQRRLLQAQLPDRLGEVDLRSGLDPDRCRSLHRPVGGGVEVLAENLPPRVALGVLVGQLRLDDLALEIPLGIADAEVAHELLGDRRPSLDHLSRLQVLQRRAADALVVDPAVLVEALVLDRHGSQLQALGHAVDRDRLPSFVGVDEAQLAAVPGVEDRVAAAVDLLAGGERGRLGGDVEHPGGHRHRAQADRHDDPGGEEEHLAGGATAPPLTSTVALRHRLEGTSAAVPAQACVSSVERLWTTPSTSSWFGITTEVPSPGLT